MYDEDDLLPLSGVQHLVFCERQCALIHVERLWRDNSLTLEGANLHRHAHSARPSRELREGVVVCRQLPVRSLSLGLSGSADVVEFHRPSAEQDVPVNVAQAVSLRGLPGLWVPFPVEYKRGKPKPDASDRTQLCAQAMCLEEMLGVPVAAGALYYARLRRRQHVLFDSVLRSATVEAARRFHDLLAGRVTPAASKGPKCRRCSMFELCRPAMESRRRSARDYFDAALAAARNSRVESE